MRLKTIFYTTCIALLSACSTDSETTIKIAKGNKVYGGNFRFQSAEHIESLLPTSTFDQYANRVTSQIFEPILNVDVNNLNVVPCLAESFSTNADKTIYTFKIRKGIFFHEDDCFEKGTKELTAHDVKFSFDLACSGLPLNKIGFHLINRVKGAEEFYQKTKEQFDSKGVSGIKVIDDNTIEIHLTEAQIGFEKIVANSALSIHPKEAFDKYGDKIEEHPVGTGPFKLAKYTDDNITLTRNASYWKTDEFGNNLPFMDSVTVTYVTDKRSELLAFRNSDIDVVYEIPVEEIEHILGTLQEAQEGKNIIHKIESSPSLFSRYLGFKNDHALFSKPEVRKAFNLAINKDKVVEVNLEGEGIPLLHGFVPPFDNYPNDRVKGYKFNPEQAKQLMASAGHADGKNVDTLKLYVNGQEGGYNHKMAQGVVEQIKNHLSVSIELIPCTIQERDEAIKSGEADLWAAGWIADYADPENFLSLFYSKNIENELNSFDYSNETYDKMYLETNTINDPVKRMNTLAQCDQMVIDDAVIVPLVSKMHTILINGRVRNLVANSMETLYLTDVYIKPIKLKDNK